MINTEVWVVVTSRGSRKPFGGGIRKDVSYWECPGTQSGRWVYRCLLVRWHGSSKERK